jgi:hypothetical protein
MDITYVASQWIVWALLGGAIAGIIYIAAYNHQVTLGRQALTTKRDELLSQLVQKSERMIVDNGHNDASCISNSSLR